MKTKNFAFTLIEVIIALSLSCIVVYGMMQAYRNLSAYLERAREMLNTNRKVCLLFNQMERDITTAFIPPVYKKELPDENSPKDPDLEKKQKNEKLQTYFFANVDEQEGKLIESRKVHLFKNISMINTNPLQVFNHQSVRLVRIQYELLLDKSKSKGDRKCYNLWRKETADIDNVKMKVNEFSSPTEKEKSNPIITNIIADNIKSLYIEYIFKKPQDTIDTGKKEKEEILFFDTWGQNKQTKGTVPAQIQLFIEFWDSQLLKSYPYKTSFSIFSYPTTTDTQLTGTNHTNASIAKAPSPSPQTQNAPSQITPPENSKKQQQSTGVKT